MSHREALLRAVRAAERLDVVGHESAEDTAVIATALPLLLAFGDRPGLLYFEAHPARGTDRPADLLLAVDGVGIVTIEVKGFAIDQLDDARNGTIFVSYRGRSQPKDVVQQARRAMFDAKAAIGRHVDQEEEPLCGCRIAFPWITKKQWRGRAFDQCLDMGLILLEEDLADPGGLATRLRLEAGRAAAALGRPPLQPGVLERIRRAFGDARTINEERSHRPKLDELTLGAEIDRLATLERNLSNEQQSLSRRPLDRSAHLIRGVAGSGKTIVLANNLANRLLRSHRVQGDLFAEAPRPPTPRIAAVCFNRSLVPFIRRKIADAYVSRSGRDEDPRDQIHVSHLNGLMYQLSLESDLDYEHVRGRDQEEVAASYLTQMRDIDFANRHRDRLFDSIYVDETQDFSPSALRLLQGLLKPGSDGRRNLVLFYDDAQNVYGRPRPVWRELGIDVVGGRTSVMKACYRNTRPIVDFSFNVLLGSQAHPGERARTRTFADVETLRRHGLVRESETGFRISFTERLGPPPVVESFPDRAAEVAWMAERIDSLIGDEGVRPEDIMVLFEGREFDRDSGLRGAIARGCRGVAGLVHPHEDGQKDDYILRPQHLTLTTTRSAKGYDDWIVFVVGADRFATTREGRASFYVGCTRAKQLLYVSGVGDGGLLPEARLVAEVVREAAGSGSNVD